MAEDLESCGRYMVDNERTVRAADEMKSDRVFMLLGETFKVLGDPTRLKILYILSKEELCVCEIFTVLGMTQSAVSHQLRILRNMRLVKYRKSGRSVFYSLDDEHINNLFREGLEHVEEGSAEPH